MPLVFISYNRKDGKIAKALRDQIAARGLDVFLDIDSIAPSQQFPQATAESVAKCDLVLLLWSHNAASSKFVTDEWNIALAQKKAIFPVLLDDCPLPAALSAINAWPLMAAPKLANRIVGLLVKTEGSQIQGTSPKRSMTLRFWRRKGARWRIAILAVALLGGLVIGMPAAITWKAYFPTPPPPRDSVSTTSEPPTEVGSKSLPIVQGLSSIILQGEIFDGQNSKRLQGVQVCVDGKKQDGSACKRVCVQTDIYGQFRVEIKASKTGKIKLIIDGSTLGYATNIRVLDANLETHDLHYSLYRL